MVELGSAWTALAIDNGDMACDMNRDSKWQTRTESRINLAIRNEC